MTTTNQVAIEAVGLVKKYGSTTALAGVDLSVPTGTVLGVLGPNGAGKTTAVRILGTLLRPDSRPRHRRRVRRRPGGRQGPRASSA